jgi:hypothetical protein
MRLYPLWGAPAQHLRCSSDRRRGAGHSGDLPQVAQGANAACCFRCIGGSVPPEFSWSKMQETLQSFVRLHCWGRVVDGIDPSTAESHVPPIAQRIMACGTVAGGGTNSLCSRAFAGGPASTAACGRSEQGCGRGCVLTVERSSALAGATDLCCRSRRRENTKAQAPRQRRG